MTDRGILSSGEGPAGVHLVVVGAIDADMQTAEDVPIYRIQTVSALTGIPARRIRNWEDEYKLLSPARTKGGHRLYSAREVKRLRDIQRLVAEQGLSLQAVKAWLEANQGEPGGLG